MIIEWTERFVEFATTWLWLVLLATWRALPILVIVAGIGLAYRRKLASSLHALLLTIVVVRLLIPISIGSPLSLHKPIDNWFSSDSGESANRHRLMMAYDHKSALLPNVDQVVLQDAVAQTQLHSPQTLDYSLEEIIGLSLLVIVIFVSIGLILRSVFSHVRFAIGLRSCRFLDDQPLIDLVLRECDSLAVGRRPTLREVPSLAAPAVFGLFRQTICLPPGLTETLSDQELRWVIRHELAHIRRRDIPVVMIASVAGAFHWFNPIVWVIISRLRAATEIAADRLAVQSLTPSEISAYGDLLLRFAQDSVAAKKSPTIGLISFASGKHLKRRVELLMRDSKPNGLTAKCLSTGLVGAIALAGLTDAREAIDRKLPEVNLVSSDSPGSRVAPLWFGPLSDQEIDGPTFVKTYDLTSILETVPKLLKSELNADKKTPLEQFTTWIPLPPWMKEKLHVDGETLSAELTASQHQALKQTLDIWKDGEPGQITIEARFIRTDSKIAIAIDWAKRRIEGLTVRGLGPAIAARIDQAELAQLIRAVSTDRKGNILFAPKVTLFDGQTAGIANQVQRPFVTGVDPKADGRIQPVVSLVDDGISLELTPRAGDADNITLAFKVKAASIGKVSYANLPFRTSDNAEPQLTVQVPATEQYELSSSVKLAEGESIVVAIPRVFDNTPGADSETTMIVALTPRIIHNQETSTISSANR
jgi:beta-lactamase regulating signal transducer with metallopeptidase domain